MSRALAHYTKPVSPHDPVERVNRFLGARAD